MTAINLLEITPNGIVLTPNERLCRRLHQVYGEQSLAQGNRVWALPPIYSWSNFIQKLYQQAVEQGLTQQVLLTDLQARNLWSQATQNILSQENFLNPRQTALEMQKGWQILQQWRLPYQTLAEYQEPEAQLLLRCIGQLDKILQKNHWCTAEQLPEILSSLPLKSLCEQLANQALTQITLFAFDEKTPQIDHFCQLLAKAKLHLKEEYWQIQAQHCEQQVLLNAEEEYQAMAAWAKAELKHGKQQIACVVPELTAHRSTLSRIFYDSFHPQKLFEPYASSPYFNISGGEPLAQLPLFQTLLQFLSIFETEISYSTLSNLLLSPFIAQAETEQFARIKLDLKLRATVLQHLDYHAVPLYLLNEHAPLFSLLWQQAIIRHPKQQLRLPSQWIEWLNELLISWGWPGERVVNSQEYQQLTQWHNLMAELVTLDPFCDLLNFSQFTQLLKEALTGTIFEMKTQDAPIQILGVLEATGSLFDAIWISGLTNKQWPPQVKPHAYLPIDLQRRYQMPHSSSQRQLDYSCQMMQRWLNSASALYFSHPAYHHDEPLSASPLLANMTMQTATFSFTPIQKNFTHALETVEETAWVTFLSAEKKTFSASIFEQQLNCPFQAFAKQRLASEEFPTPLDSWDPRLRGIHLHAALEKIWRHFQHSETLKQCSADELTLLLNDIITQVLKKSLPALVHNKDYFQLEQQRLMHILQSWLIIEKSRPPFSVTHIEYSQQYQIEALTIKLRIDRIDTTTAQENILIDYKTGIKSIGDWLGEPMKGPQMPLYAAFFEHTFDVITYACLHPSEEKMQFVGLSRNEIEFPKITALNALKKQELNWEELMENWRLQLKLVAIEIGQGYAAIAPREKDDTCRLCHLSSLCRIQHS